MSEVERKYKLLVDHNVSQDIRDLKREDPYAHAQVFVLLQELRSDQLLCENLIDENYSDDIIEDIVPFWHLQDSRLNVYRLKMFNAGRWRILVAGDHARREVAILAIMHRGQDYQKDKNLIARLKDSYEKLNFRELGR